MNFDGILRGNPSVSRVGWVIHSDYSKVSVEFVKLLEQDMNDIPEIKTVVEGLKLYKELGFRRVEIKGYSTLTVNALRTRQTLNWRLKAVLNKALEL